MSDTKKNLLDWAKERDAQIKRETEISVSQDYARERKTRHEMTVKYLRQFISLDDYEVTVTSAGLEIEGVCFTVMDRYESYDLVILGFCPKCGQSTVSENIYSEAALVKMLTNPFEPLAAHTCPDVETNDPEESPPSDLDRMTRWIDAALSGETNEAGCALIATAMGVRGLCERLDRMIEQK